MLNRSEFYRDLGIKAAQARNQNDEARASFHAKHFREAKALERGADRQLADELYRNGYESARRT